MQAVSKKKLSFVSFPQKLNIIFENGKIYRFSVLPYTSCNTPTNEALEKNLRKQVIVSYLFVSSRQHYDAASYYKPLRGTATLVCFED